MTTMAVMEKLVKQAISHFSYGVSRDIFSEPVTTYAKLAIEALKKENGVTVQEWISVKDRLPEDQEEVLVCTRSKNGVRNIDKGYMAIDRFIHRGRAEVTHWMPLPQPPKVE